MFCLSCSWLLLHLVSERYSLSHCSFPTAQLANDCPFPSFHFPIFKPFQCSPCHTILLPLHHGIVLIPYIIPNGPSFCLSPHTHFLFLFLPFILHLATLRRLWLSQSYPLPACCSPPNLFPCVIFSPLSLFSSSLLYQPVFSSVDNAHGEKGRRGRVLIFIPFFLFLFAPVTCSYSFFSTTPATTPVFLGFLAFPPYPLFLFLSLLSFLFLHLVFHPLKPALPATA